MPRLLWTVRLVFIATANPGTSRRHATAIGGVMRKLIVSSLVSLDGIHGDPQSWAGDFFDEQAVQESLATLLDSDAMLLGRNTYENFAPVWSSRCSPTPRSRPTAPHSETRPPASRSLT